MSRLPLLDDVKGAGDEIALGERVIHGNFFKHDFAAYAEKIENARLLQRVRKLEKGLAATD